MSASFLFIGMILLGGILTYLAYKIKFILLSILAATSWLAFGLFVLLSGAQNLDVSDSWVQMLGILCIAMAFVPLALMVRTETTVTSKKGIYSKWVRNPEPKESRREHSLRVRAERRKALKDRIGR